MNMKKKFAIVVSMILVMMMVSVVSPLAAQLYDRLTVAKAVEMVKQNDLETERAIADDELENLRHAFLAGADRQMGPWPVAYRHHVRPLLDDAADLDEDFQTDNSERRRELNSYQEVFSFWLVTEQRKVNEENVRLANKDLENAKIRLQLGTASQLDVLQFEVNANTAKASLGEVVTNHEAQKYSINQKLKQALQHNISIDTPKFTYLDKNLLNREAVKQKVVTTHPYLEAMKTRVAAFKKAYQVVTEPDFDLEYDSLPVYLEREIAIYGLMLRQQTEQMEISTYRYIDRLNQLKRNIELQTESLAHSEKIYEGAVVQFDNGLMTIQDLEKARLNFMSVRLELLSSQRQYMETKEEYRLFLAGYLPTGN